MALNVITEPGDIAFARNQVIVQLRSAQTAGGETYSAKGVRSDLTIILAQRFATNETYTVVYDEPDGTTETIVFTAKAVYDDPNEIPDNSFVGTDFAYWEAVAGMIQAHPRIAPYFTCTVVTISGTTYLRLQARSVETGWDVSTTNSHGFTVTNVPAVPDATPANYKVLLEVFFESVYRGGDYTTVAQLEALPDPVTGNLNFDIGGILEAEARGARTEPQVPVWGGTSPSIADNLRRYYYRFTETYGAPAVNQEWQYGLVKLCIDGGLSQGLYAAEPFWLGGIDNTNSLFSWQADGRQIGPNQPDFAQWYNYTGANKMVVLEFKAYDVDTGLVQTTQYLHEAGPNVRPNETILLPCGPSIFSPAGDVYKYAVRVVDADSDWEGGFPDYLSESRTYYIDRSYYESERYLQYLNAFGLPECRRCTGIWSKKLTTDRKDATRPLAAGYNEFATERYQYARTWQTPLQYRTGFISRAEAETLQELLLSGEVYDVSAEGYIPLLITTNAFEVTDTARDLHSYSFSAIPRLDARNYSKKKLVAAAPGAWQEPGGESWFDAFLIEWNLP